MLLDFSTNAVTVSIQLVAHPLKACNEMVDLVKAR
jgi:hypothetical protein